MEISITELEQLARKMSRCEETKKADSVPDVLIGKIKVLQSSLDATLKENAELKEIVKKPVPCWDCVQTKELKAIIETGKAANKEQYDRIVKLENDNESLHAENRRLEEKCSHLETERNFYLNERSEFICKIGALQAHIAEHEGVLPEELK